MTLVRTASAVLLSMFVSHAGHSIAQAGTPPAATAFSRPQWKSPYSPTARPLTTEALATLGGYGHVTAEQYKDLSLAAQTLLKKFPADKHYFVGIGRDPAPPIAFLQNVGGKELAVNFPASSNSAGNTNVAALPAYVNKLIPKDALTSGHTIVFVDVTSSGRALNHYVPLLTALLRGAKVKRVAFASPDWPNIHQNPGENIVITTTRFRDVDQYFGGIYEDVVSEYPRHVPGFNDMNDLKKPLATYRQFRDAVMKRMQRDERLHHFLTRRAGPAFVPESPEEAAQRVLEEKAEAER